MFERGLLRYIPGAKRKSKSMICESASFAVKMYGIMCAKVHEIWNTVHKGCPL